MKNIMPSSLSLPYLYDSSIAKDFAGFIDLHGTTHKGITEHETCEI